MNNLASKLLLALLPPGAPFFRQQVDEAALAELEESGTEADKAAVESGLAQYERFVLQDIEASGDRVVLFEALKHFVAGGNVLLDVEKSGMRAHHLSNYVVRRAPNGDILEIVIKEQVAPNTLPEKIQNMLSNHDEHGDEETVDLFTYVKRDGKMFRAHQEVLDMIVPDSHASHPVDRPRFIPLRYNRIEGEDYGRGFVEELIGDLNSLDALMQAIVEGSAISSKVLFMIDPNGVTEQDDLEESPNGGFVAGKEEDVSTLRVDKLSDFRTTLETINRIEARLEQSFLLNASVQRDAERVTAEEIRFLASELEDALGGVYSILTQEFQLPYVNRKISILVNSGRLRPLPKGIVRPVIVTGIEALGRGHDLRRLRLFIQTAYADLGPELVAPLINVRNMLTRIATSTGVDTEGLLKTEAEVQQEQQLAQQQALLDRTAPELVKQGGQALQNGGTPNGESTQ